MLIYTQEYINDLSLIKSSIKQLEELKNKTILITGAGGLICSAIVDFLMQLNVKDKYNIKVYATGRNITKLNNRFNYWKEIDGLIISQYDVLEECKINDNIDYIISGASCASPDIYMKKPSETMMTTIMGTKNMLEYVKKMNKARVLFISSSEVYGKNESGEMYKEEDYGYVDILNTRSCYPMAKRTAETLCETYRYEYNIDYVVVRPGHIYGPTMNDTDNRVSSLFPRLLKQGKDIVMKSDGRQIRSYCYVLDCVSAIIISMINGNSGEAYNISNKNSVISIRQMAECFAKEMNKDIVFECANAVEKQRFNMMDNSSLNAQKLELLGWNGLFNMSSGAKRTLNSLEI